MVYIREKAMSSKCRHNYLTNQRDKQQWSNKNIDNNRHNDLIRIDNSND